MLDKIPLGELKSPGVRIRDIAAVAGLSVSTVSKAINRPHLVAAETREKVACLVRELNFRPLLHPQELRPPVPGPPYPSAGVAPSSTQDSQISSSDARQDNRIQPYRETGKVRIESALLVPGEHLCLWTEHEAMSGTVDAVMADESCFWIWVDGGLGRRMVIASDVLALQTDRVG